VFKSRKNDAAAVTASVTLSVAPLLDTVAATLDKLVAGRLAVVCSKEFYA